MSEEKLVKAVQLLVEKQEKTNLLLEELLKWERFQSMQKARDLSDELLKTDIEKLIYFNSNGEKTSREIGSSVGVSHATVSNYWKKWAKLGIVKELTTRGGGTRYQGIFSLTDLGMDIPKTPTDNSESATPV